MSQLTFATVPGFVDLPDSALAADEPLTDYSLTKISNNAKFAAVRPETFCGWYRNGEVVKLPVSLARRLRALARSTGESLSSLVTRGLEDWLHRVRPGPGGGR